MSKVIMKNVLCNVSYYRSKSILNIDIGTTVDFGTCTPFMSLKFATRADMNSGGNWKDENIYYFTNYLQMIDFATRFKAVVASPNNKDEVAEASFNNPAKQKGIYVRKSYADGGKIFIVCNFFIGPKDNQEKINVSLTMEEATALVTFMGTFVNNYPVIAQTALLRKDIWFEYFGKRKSDSTESEAPAQSQSRSTSKPAAKQQPQRQVDQSLVSDLENEFGSIGGGAGGFGEDVPF